MALSLNVWRVCSLGINSIECSLSYLWVGGWWEKEGEREREKSVYFLAQTICKFRKLNGEVLVSSNII